MLLLSRGVLKRFVMSKPTRKRSTAAGSDAEKKVKSSKIVFDGKVLQTDEEVRERDGYTEPLPKRDKYGCYIFDDCEIFRPNRSPKEVLQAGSFGGTYFRSIKSSVAGATFDKQWLELPQNWLEGLNIPTQIAGQVYTESRNKYGKKCGGDLHMWESSGWIKKQDPYGWFQWYCRYYLGRRTADDERQITRWKNCTGPKGRWKNTLIGKIVKAGVGYDNTGISPVIRQVLLHWGYELTERDFEARKKILATQKK
eukprot:sb/3468624/